MKRNTKETLDLNRLPRHIAVIMDGNGRWAESHGKPRVYGHKNGVESVRQITESCAELGVANLSLFAFSTENWKRPQMEVNALMQLLVETIHSEIETLQKNNIRLHAIGDTSSLPDETEKALEQAIQLTQDNSRMNLILALNYSGKWDLTHAFQKALEAGVKEINEETLSQYLSTADFPDPELMIRTSGEIRISNFFLWQLAYTELYFTEVHWPDFRKENLYEAIHTFQKRERRYGQTSAQIEKS